MRKVVNKSSTYYSYTGLISLIFFEILLLIFLFIFFREIEVVIVLLIPNFIFIRAIILVLKYFISVEECYCIGEKFYYKKTLWRKWTLRKLEIPIDDIKLIQDKGKLILETELKEASIGYLLYYFNPYERICIETTSGKTYDIWNYKKRPSYWSMDNLYEGDTEFFNSLFEIRGMILEIKEQILFTKNLKRLEAVYTGEVEERYRYILEKILDEEKVFSAYEKENLVVNSDTEAIKNLGILEHMNFEEIDFYTFYVNYLSKKEYENRIVEVGYNGVDSKKVTMKQLKEDINRLRDSN